MRGIALLFCLVLSACHTVGGPDTISAFEEWSEDGVKFNVSTPKGYTARYGYLSVSESHEAVESTELLLPVIVLKGPNSKPDLDPVIYLAGGPGVGSLAAASYARAYPWSAERDFIVFGQRGTQYSQTPLMCPEFVSALEDGADLQGKIEAITACRDRLSEASFDLSQYHSRASAADIEQLRIALGYEKIALYGLSYGTRLALTYARDYPDSVSAIVLDSPLPHTADYDDESVDNYFDAVARVVALCLKDTECRSAYPSLLQDVLSVDQDTSLPLDSRNDLENLPLNLSKAGETSASSGVSNFAWGMRLSVWCSEAWPYSARFGRDDHSDKSLVFAPELCEAWGVPARPIEETAATVSSVPTLIIAGEFDAVTPAKWGYQAAETLENSRVLVIPNGLHTETTNWGGDGCAMSLAVDFFSDPDGFVASNETPNCIGTAKPLEFALPAAN